MAKQKKSKKSNRVIEALLRDCPQLCGPRKCKIIAFMMYGDKAKELKTFTSQ